MNAVDKKFVYPSYSHDKDSRRRCIGVTRALDRERDIAVQEDMLR